MLMPETFRATDAQSDAIDSNTELLEKLGIEIESFGPKTIAIQAFPTLLSRAEPVDFVKDLADMLVERGTNGDAEGLLDDVLHMAACKAAIKAGQKLSDAEIDGLLADKLTTESSSHCPHGRPTSIKFTLTELEKQFKRT
jgi:DNA mismatch repair protein MutL